MALSYGRERISSASLSNLVVAGKDGTYRYSELVTYIGLRRKLCMSATYEQLTVSKKNLPIGFAGRGQDRVIETSSNRVIERRISSC